MIIVIYVHDMLNMYFIANLCVSARALSLSLSPSVYKLDALSFAHFCSYSWDALLGFSLVPDGFLAFFWCVCASFAWYRALA